MTATIVYLVCVLWTFAGVVLVACTLPVSEFHPGVIHSHPSLPEFSPYDPVPRCYVPQPDIVEVAR
jgi:hypothetical protein